MSDADVAEILKLPPEERLRLVEIIWESLSTTPSVVPVGAAHWAAIDEELAEHRRNQDDVLTHEEWSPGCGKRDEPVGGLPPNTI